MVQLAKEHYMILMSLINNPTISTNALKDELEKSGIMLSYHLVNKRLEELKDWGILRKEQEIMDPIVPGNRRTISEVEANYAPQTLGLQRHHVIYFDIAKGNEKKFARVCNLHPYTHYRTLAVSDGVSAYAEFDIPLQGLNKFSKFISKFNQLLSAKKFMHLIAEKTTRSEIDLARYNISGNAWQYSVYEDTGESSLEYYWHHFEDHRNYTIESSEQSKLTEIDYLDLQIIRELNINAKVKNLTLSEVYNKDPSTISKRISKIDDEILDLPTLYYDRYQFDVSLPQILVGKFEKYSDIAKLHHITDHYFPFRSTLITNQDKFIWIMNTPPSLSSEISYFIWTVVADLNVLPLSIHRDKSWRYPLYPNNFNQEVGDWRTDDEYFVYDPLIT